MRHTRPLMTMEVPGDRVKMPGECPFQVERGERVIALVSLHHWPRAYLVGNPACTAASARTETQPSCRKRAYSRGMPEWIGSAATMVTALVALAALIVSIWASRRVARKREFELLLERIDREAAKREAKTHALAEQIDREAAKREAKTHALAEQIDREAAKREAEMHALAEQIDREAAKREAETRAFTERIEREAAKREERFEREVAKREEAIRDALDRSDRKFEALQRRSDEMYRLSAEITARMTHTEAVLETAAKADPATRQGEAVAAQDVLGDRPGE